MDGQTMAAYEGGAAAYAEDWERQPPPLDMYLLLQEHFTPGPSADVGCGSGRDTAWLDGHDFPAVGFDASTRLLEQARALHPGITFERAELPQLAGIDDGCFVNVLCETVLMHLPSELVGQAVRRLLAIASPNGGTIYISWRVTAGEDQRTDDGRLYSAFDAELVRAALAGTRVLHDEQARSESSGRIVHRIIARRGDRPS